MSYSNVAIKAYKKGVSLHLLGNHNEALCCFKKSAELNYPLAYFELYCYCSTSLEKLNLHCIHEQALQAEQYLILMKRSYTWYAQAAYEGNVDAQFIQSELHTARYGHPDRMKQEFYLNQAANSGCLRAKAAMIAYESNEKKAFQDCLNLAASHPDFSKAHCMLGDMYKRGSGVAKNLKLAIQEYKKSAELGGINAAYKYTSCLLRIKGGGNYKLAEEFCLKAATANHYKAQIIYGNLCEKKGDNVNAQQWYCKEKNCSAHYQVTYCVKTINAGKNNWHFVLVRPECLLRFWERASDNFESLKRFGAILKSTDDHRKISSISSYLKKKIKLDSLESKTVDLDFSKSIFLRGEALNDHGHYEAALPFFLQAARLDYPPSYLRLFFFYCKDEYKNNKKKSFYKEKSAEYITWFHNSATSGEAFLQYCFAACYHDGIGITQNYEQAYIWFRKSAIQGYARGQYILGMYYNGGFGIAKDMKKSVYWHRKSSFLGFNYAQYSLALCCESGVGLNKDITQAMLWYCEAENQGVMNAKEKIKHLLSCDPINNVNKIYFLDKLNREQYKKALNGDANLQKLIGKKHEQGLGLAKNFQDAIRWYRKSANQAHSGGQYKVGFCYENGLGVTKSFVKAAKWYRMASEQGNLKARERFLLCEIEIPREKERLLLEKSKQKSRREQREREEKLLKKQKEDLERQKAELAEIKQRELKAEQLRDSERKIYELEQKRLHELAQRQQCELEKKQALLIKKQQMIQKRRALGQWGELNIDLDGVLPVSRKKEQKIHYQQARELANKGDAKAQYAVGECYRSGKGVKKSLEYACFWYQKSASGGCSDAQYQLANCYEYGKGVDVNHLSALQWYKAAAEHGNIKAKAKKEFLMKGYNGEQEKEGETWSYNEQMRQDKISSGQWGGSNLELSELLSAMTKKEQQYYYEQTRKRANLGDAKAQYAICECYLSGSGVNKNLNYSKFWCEKAAKSGSIEAQYHLANCYEHGKGVRMDHAKAFQQYKIAGHNGSVDAQVRLGKLYSIFETVQTSESNSLNWYKKAALQGDAEGQYFLAQACQNGVNVEPFLLESSSLARALKWYEDSAAQGYAPSEYCLGVFYNEGIPVVKDLQKAFLWYQKAANQGHAEAQTSLGHCYKYGYGTALNSSFAIEWYRKAAIQYYSEGQYQLGQCYEHGFGVCKNVSTAVQWYYKSAEQGHAESQFNLGCYYENRCEYNDKTDMKEAVAWYHGAAKQSHVEAQYHLARCYEHGLCGSKSLDKAIIWYRKAANQGHGLSQYHLARCYQYGFGVKKNNVDAVFWYKKSALLGEVKDAESQYFLGKAYGAGIGTETSSSDAVIWYRKAAEQEYAQSQYQLGQCYEYGFGVCENASTAAQWYCKSAEQGHAESQYHLGCCYEHGIGVIKNQAAAVTWYEKSALLNKITAKASQYLLGHSYERGIGVRKNSKEAVKWYRKAAEKDHGVSQYHLGRCYEHGIGVTRSQALAATWYEKAALLEEPTKDSASQYLLGHSYENGIGVEKNLSQAIIWYQRINRSYSDVRERIKFCESEIHKFHELIQLGKKSWPINQNKVESERALKYFESAFKIQVMSEGKEDYAEHLIKYGDLLSPSEESLQYFMKAAELGSYFAYFRVAKYMEKNTAITDVKGLIAQSASAHSWCEASKRRFIVLDNAHSWCEASKKGSFGSHAWYNEYVYELKRKKNALYDAERIKELEKERERERERRLEEEREKARLAREEEERRAARERERVRRVAEKEKWEKEREQARKAQEEQWEQEKYAEDCARRREEADYAIEYSQYKNDRSELKRYERSGSEDRWAMKQLRRDIRYFEDS